MPRPKLMTEFKELTSDDMYRTELAKGVGCKSEELKSVMGTDELIQFLKTSKPENFNPTSPEFNANLHLHTKASDGNFTPETLFNEVLKEAANKKFIIAITDHDTTDGVKEALCYIAKETKKTPDKFKNVRFVPGIEFFCKYENPDFMNKPFTLELIGYSINPYSNEFSEFEEGNRDKDRNIIKEVIQRADEEYGIDTSDFSKYKKSKRLLQVPSGVHVEHLLKKYLEKKKMPEDKQHKLLKDYFPQAIPSMDKIIKASKGGIVGISHPIRMKRFYAHVKDRSITEEAALLRFFKDFKKQGGQTAEGNYYLPPERNYQAKMLPNKPIKEKEELIADLCDKAGLLKTGGIDNHGLSLHKFN